MSAAFLYLRLFITVHEVEVIVLQRALRFFLTRSGVRVSRFLLGGTAALVGLGAVRYAGSAPLVRPPGGQDEDALVSACIRCEKCYEVCPRRTWRTVC